MTFKLSYEENPSPEDVHIVLQGIIDSAEQKKGFSALDFFSFFVRGNDHRVLGGCLGGAAYGGMHIDSLWIDEPFRNKGWGSKLVNAVINYGREKNCLFLTVNTMDWEALDFYQKLGFEVEFKRTGFQKNSILYFLRLPLS